MTKAQDKKLILLVDDAPANIKVAHEILKDLYKTRVATNGAMALEAAKASPPPDLILLDVMMPGMDGYEVCARLKSDPFTREIPVIFLTAMTEAVDETRGFAAGAVDYIHKPFSPPVLLARVQTHLKLREAYEQLFETVLGTFAPPEPAAAFDTEVAAALLVRLRSLLEAKDGDAADAVQEVAGALAGGVDAKLLAALRASVEEFDFPSALAKLGEIATECNLSLDEPASRMPRKIN
ncbi:MAG TPA: response regulator [Candidatus Acidoferrales bacterium]|nr:response regulator [Candidatus Acidoferrales bacterium]